MGGKRGKEEAGKVRDGRRRRRGTVSRVRVRARRSTGVRAARPRSEVECLLGSCLLEWRSGQSLQGSLDIHSSNRRIHPVVKPLAAPLSSSEEQARTSGLALVLARRSDCHPGAGTLALLPARAALLLGDAGKGRVNVLAWAGEERREVRPGEGGGSVGQLRIPLAVGSRARRTAAAPRGESARVTGSTHAHLVLSEVDCLSERVGR